MRKTKRGFTTFLLSILLPDRSILHCNSAFFTWNCLSLRNKNENIDLVNYKDITKHPLVKIGQNGKLDKFLVFVERQVYFTSYWFSKLGKG